MKVVDPVAHARQMARIQHIALHLFAQRGCRETTMDHLARACRMQKASLYHYFRSKDDVLKAIIQWRIKEIHRRIMDLPKARGLEACLLHIGSGFLKDLDKRDNNDFMKILLRDAHSSPSMRKIFFDLFKEKLHSSHEILCRDLLFKSRGMSGRDMMRFMHQYMGCLIRYATETRLWKEGPCIIFTDKEYVASLAKIFARGVQP